MILSVLTLFACEGGGDAPEGLQVGCDSDDLGYTFYAPENWAVVNSGEISGAKVSAINNTSITFAKAMPPVGTIPEYFESSLADFPEAIKSTMKIVERDKTCLFGNAKGEAYKYVYTYKYEDFDFACMQILLTHNSEFYIFTYTSYGDVNDESSYYNTYLPVVQLAIDNFTFKKKVESSERVNFGTDSDGYILVSDEKLAGFKLYLPEDYDVVYSNAFVKAEISDGANLSLSKATQTGINIISYLENRKDEMKRFTTDFTDISICVAKEIDTSGDAFKDFPFDMLPEYDETLVFGDLDPAGIISYEYKYTFCGEVYHVYQVMGVDSFSGYVFTYTALEGEYNEHIDEIKGIIGKVDFK